jgi:crotonobetainyl-CoA:carnitine CoA-transferase CaiB-like acyl-CoA transferase
MPMPLEGIRVLDWTIWQQGPVATMMLADLGADVIKIESRDGGDPGRALLSSGGVDMNSQVESAYFEGNNRNKRSITLDLKRPEARQIVYQLAGASDVFAHNFRKGVPERLGIGYDDLKAHNQKLIYAVASGYGPEGPDAGDPSFDLMGQARSGLMMAVGDPGSPPLQVGGGVSDQVGAMVLCHGIMTALLARERFGMGQRVDTSHLGSMAWMQALSLSSKLMAGSAHPRMTRTESFNPLWNSYQCADGQWLCLAMIQADRYWADFCKVLEREDMITDERFATLPVRAQNGRACVAEMDAEFIKRPRAEWMERLKRGGDFIFTGVQTVDELATDVQMLANDYVVDYEHPSYGTIQHVGLPVQLSETPGGLRLPAPQLGQHTEEVLMEVLDYSWDDISELRKKEIL